MRTPLLGSVLTMAVAANATIYTASWNSGFANDGIVADNNLSGWSDTRSVSTMPAGTFASLSVNLQLTGG